MAPRAQANDRTDERIRAATFEVVQGGMSFYLSPLCEVFSWGHYLFCVCEQALILGTDGPGLIPQEAVYYHG